MEKLDIMKRVLFVVVLGIVSILFIPNVEAASPPYQWIVNGEELRWGQSNSTKTATYTSITDSTGAIVSGKLTLNNYNGGAIKLDCYGSKTNMNFTVELIGDNYITEKNGVGISAVNNISFSGNGTLTIDAITPISRTITNDTSTGSSQIIKIVGSDNDLSSITEDNEITDTTSNENDKNNDVTTNTTNTDAKSLDYNLYFIISIVFSCVILIFLTIILISLKKKKQ